MTVTYCRRCGKPKERWQVYCGAACSAQAEAEGHDPAGWWWLSFADETGFRGVVITHAANFMAAHLAVTMLGLNPGGEVRGFPYPAGEVPEPGDVGRLLTREDMDRIGVRVFRRDKPS